MKKIKLIVSDFHLGKGKRLGSGAMNALEDFHHDHRFKEFLEYYSTGEYEDYDVELIFNGDMMNMIQLDYHGHYTVVITESVSIEKLKAIIEGHTVFFKSLREFLSQPKHSLTYIIGNHDQELMWEGARALFEEAVGRDINWKNIYHLFDGVHIEHGHQYETVNRMDPTQPFLTEGLDEPIVNLPWGTLFTMQYIIKLKQVRPHIDKVRPFRLMIRWSLANDTFTALVWGFRVVLYFISTRFSKNRHRQTSMKTTLKMLLETSVFPDLSEAAKRILRTPDIHTVIFGHTHVYKHMQFGDEKQYINLGTWTDIINLELENFARRSRLTYVRVEYDDTNAKPTSFLRHWIGRIPLEDDALGL